MRKFISLLTAGILILGALTSCNLDKDMSSTFSFQATVTIQDQTVAEEMEKYMKENFVDRSNLPHHFGKAYDAKEQFIAYFTQTVKEADQEFILSTLQEKGDFISLTGYITNDYGRDWVGTRTWTYEEGHPAQ